MESPASHFGRASRIQFSKQKRSGYEPSDTETDWHDSPWHDHTRRFSDLAPEVPNTALKQVRNVSPLMPGHWRYSARFAHEVSSPVKASTASLSRRSHSKSPYKPHTDDGNVRAPAPNRSVSPLSTGLVSGVREINIGPLSKSEIRRQVSPLKPMVDIHVGNNRIRSSHRKQNHKHLGSHVVGDEENGNDSQLNEVRMVSEKSNYSRRSLSAPRPKAREMDGTKAQQIKYDNLGRKGDKTPCPLSRDIYWRKEMEASHSNAPSVGEINEMVANAKISKFPVDSAPKFDSTDSIGNIFFSRDQAAFTMQQIIFPKDGDSESRFGSKPKVLTGVDSIPHQGVKATPSFDNNVQGISSSTTLTRTTASSSAVSMQSSGKSSTGGSIMSDASGRTSESLRKFTANRLKKQKEVWFSCIKRGTCSISKSPEKIRDFDEALFIEKAFVVENLRQFWADKYRPGSLEGFICHKQEAQVLKEIASDQAWPHILLKGPPGSGKKALTMAFLCEIYGDSAWNISHGLRYIQLQETRAIQLVIPVTSSSHHVELNVYFEPNAKHALLALVRDMTDNFAPEISNANSKTDYKVMVLYGVDKASENIQHMVKWIMDCYSDSCKLILCCEDDVGVPESVKNRCKVFEVDPPLVQEIVEVLIHIAKKEDFELSTSFAERIATKSKQNLRIAIMALEACKAHNYPFVDDQPILLGWEDVLEELASEVLADPFPRRLRLTRGRLQKLLQDFVHPRLILQKLVEQFLKGVEASVKRQLYYWHAYYDKRLPAGASALLKLEEFVIKFMSIHRRSSNNRQHP